MRETPKNEQDMQNQLTNAFEFYAKREQIVKSNYKTDNLLVELETLKTLLIESNFTNDEMWQQILTHCKIILNKSKPFVGDVYKHDLPKTTIYNKQKQFFNDSKEINGLFANSFVDVMTLDSNEDFVLPSFVINSSIEHPNKIKQTSLFSLFGEIGQEYK